LPVRRNGGRNDHVRLGLRRIGDQVLQVRPLLRRY
jgi:hypothetical protein